MTIPAATQDDPPPWYKRRGYPHFDRQLSPQQAIALVEDKHSVAQRAFLPFIAFDISQKRYKKQSNGSRRIGMKQRQVAFASHADSHIFAYYARLLKEPLEYELERRRISGNVIAYRRFDPPMCNIHFARDAFVDIEQRGACTAVALDIENFFDTIPHDAIKRLWAQICGFNNLPPDHYSVFKAVTRWAKVDRDTLYEKLNISRRKQENWDRRQTLCTPEQFRRDIRGGKLIGRGYDVRNGKAVGIPQGSPISAILSNLVMLDVDSRVAAEASARNVYFRRYCDDVLIVGEIGDVSTVESMFKHEVGNLGLVVNDAKTTRSEFSCDAAGTMIASEPLQYLGFTFDGRRVLVRPQTVAKYIQRMKRGVRSAKRAARAAAKRGGTRELRRQELYARFSHLGPTRKMVRQSSSPNLRNNFYSYTKRSSREMNRLEIKRQLRRHWNLLNAEIVLAERDE